MSRVTVRYLVSYPGRGGITRYFWQPSKAMRRQGWMNVRLPVDHAEAIAEAERWNAKLDAWRRDGHSTSLEYEITQRYKRQIKRKFWVQMKSGLPVHKKTTGHPGVYVISRKDGLQKIGVSRNPWRRFYKLQTTIPDPLRLSFFVECVDVQAFALEKRVHAALSDRRFHGEWFAVTVEMAVAEIRRQHVAMRFY